MIHQKHNRLESFSDSVLAIAITLLAFELRVPILQSFNVVTKLKEIIVFIPGILTFILSFITIAIFWVNHHQMTEHLNGLNRRIMWMNIIFLMFQSIIPFATRVIAENPYHPLAVTGYSLVMFCGSLSFSLTHLFIHQKINRGKLKFKSKLIQRSIVGPFIYFAATISSLYYVPISYILLIIPPIFYFLPKHSQD